MITPEQWEEARDNLRAMTEAVDELRRQWMKTSPGVVTKSLETTIDMICRNISALTEILAGNNLEEGFYGNPDQATSMLKEDG